MHLLVQLRIADFEGVSTTSEGDEPNRYVVVEPLDDWLRAVVATSGLTALDLDGARRMLLEDSLRAVGLVGALEGPIVDVGSGGGAPESPSPTPCRSTRSCCSRPSGGSATSSRRGRRRTHAWSGAGRRTGAPIGPASRVAKALAAPPVAAEWCLPLVREGGRGACR